MTNSRLSYFIENFELAYSCKLNWEELKIGFDESCQIIFTKPDIENPLENTDSIIWKEWKGKKIPFIMNTKDKDLVIEYSDDKAKINFDIISSAYYFLSGIQEFEIKERDNYGRFKYENSLQKKMNIVDIPIVNYYFDILKDAIEFTTKSKIKSNRKFSATITHDIDEVLSGWKHRVRSEISKNNFINAIIHGITQPFLSFAPWKNLIELSDFNFKNNVNSTFFLLARNNKIDTIKNADYSLSNNYIKKSISHISKNNQEIGVHGSYKTHDSSKELQNDIKSLNKKIYGNRFHFLQFNSPESQVVIDSNKLMYDSSLGFQEKIGFRNNVCTPFKLYNFEENKSHDFIEIPLNIMDCSLEFSNYMNLSTKESFIEIKKLTQEIKKFNGNICINWHNTYFSNYLKEDWKALYIEIIKYLKQEKCQFKTCKELVK